MKKLVTLLVLVTVLCAFSVPAFAAYKAEYKLDIVPSLTTSWGMGAVYFTDLVRERSGGKINIKVYPGSQLTVGAQTNAFMLVRNGTIDFAVQSSINYSPQIIELIRWRQDQRPHDGTDQPPSRAAARRVDSRACSRHGLPRSRALSAAPAGHDVGYSCPAV